jgi:hypothetical protein
MNRQFTRLALLALVASGLFAVAQDAEWVETNSWQGAGSQQTGIFFVTGERWRIIYRPKGRGPFRVDLNRESGSDPVMITNQKGTVVQGGRRSQTGAGRFYLDIQADQAEWEVVVEQRLTAIEKWHLVQLIKQETPTLARIATWTGGTGEEEYDLTIPRGAWKLFVNVSGEGHLDLSISPAGGDGKPLLLNRIPAGETGTWIHRSGDFRIRLRASENCEWKLDACVAK